MKFAFRVDACNEIGITQFMRCQTLADALNNEAHGLALSAGTCQSICGAC